MKNKLNKNDDLVIEKKRLEELILNFKWADNEGRLMKKKEVRRDLDMVLTKYYIIYKDMRKAYRMYNAYLRQAYKDTISTFKDDVEYINNLLKKEDDNL